MHSHLASPLISNLRVIVDNKNKSAKEYNSITQIIGKIVNLSNAKTKKVVFTDEDYETIYTLLSQCNMFHAALAYKLFLSILKLPIKIRRNILWQVNESIKNSITSSPYSTRIGQIGIFISLKQQILSSSQITQYYKEVLRHAEIESEALPEDWQELLLDELPLQPTYPVSTIS